MKMFTETDAEPWAGGRGLWADGDELVVRQLPWQRRNLQQTASGYGAKLASCWMINFMGRLRRIYVACYSNSGTSWFLYKGERIVVRG